MRSLQKAWNWRGKCKTYVTSILVSCISYLNNEENLYHNKFERKAVGDLKNRALNPLFLRVASWILLYKLWFSISEFSLHFNSRKAFKNLILDPDQSCTMPEDPCVLLVVSHQCLIFVCWQKPADLGLPLHTCITHGGPKIHKYHVCTGSLFILAPHGRCVLPYCWGLVLWPESTVRAFWASHLAVLFQTGYFRNCFTYHTLSSIQIILFCLR